jgi:hypothetical protein
MLDSNDNEIDLELNYTDNKSQNSYQNKNNESEEDIK